MVEAAAAATAPPRRDRRENSLMEFSPWQFWPSHANQTYHTPPSLDRPQIRPGRLWASLNQDMPSPSPRTRAGEASTKPRCHNVDRACSGHPLFGRAVFVSFVNELGAL